MPSPSETPNILSGITYVHSLRYFTKGIDNQGPYYDVEYQIEDWDAGDDFCNALMGITTYSGGKASRTFPHRHPLSPNLVCQSAVVAGSGEEVLDPDHGYPSYAGGAIIKAVYRPPSVVMSPFDDPGFRHQIAPDQPILWCTQEIDFGVETVSFDTHDYIYEVSNKHVPVPVQYDLPLTTLVVTFHRLPYLPMVKVRAARGRINSEVFLGNEPGHVLFQGARTTRESSVEGLVQQRVQLTFVERAIPWNHFILPDQTGAPAGGLLTDRIKSKSAGPGAGYRFQEYDLRELVIL